ncbi:MAG: hypothetical protein OXH69_11190 [Acidobacteria bacterium]|nr:hypothetical protein [Acidobacteriota bacterium]
MRVTAAVVVSVVALATTTARAEPPFRDLPWIWPDVIMADDPWESVAVTHLRGGKRQFDEGWTRLSIPGGGNPTVVVHLYRAAYRDGHAIEIQVHPEYNRRRGRTGEDTRTWDGRRNEYKGPAYDEPTLKERRFTEVEWMAQMVGRLPSLMRSRIRVLTLETGYGGMWANRGRREVRFHTRFNDKLESYGAGEEYLIHEAGHLLEDEYAVTECWREAQRSDGEFISEYAASDPGSGRAGDWDGPGGEDFAETLLAYYALRWRPDRLTPADRRTIQETIPARIACMDSWGFGAERPR